MTGSANTPPNASLAQTLTQAGIAAFQVAGTGTSLDGKWVIGAMLIDPDTGAVYKAGGGTGGGPGGGAQASATDVLQNAVTGNVALAACPTGSMDGYGTVMLVIANGAGTATVTIRGSLDATFARAQDALILGVVPLSDSGAGTALARSVVSGVISVAANTTYLLQVYDVLPAVRAVVSNAAGLGAGTTDTGLTVTLWKLPI